MKAVRKFNPEVGVRLISFAVHWIKSEIHEYVLKNWKIVKVATTKAQRKLFFNLRNKKKDITWLSEDDVKMISNELDVKEDTVREMEQRMSSHDVSFDPYSADDSEEGNTYSPDCKYSPLRYRRLSRDQKRRHEMTFFAPSPAPYLP